MCATQCLIATRPPAVDDRPPPMIRSSPRPDNVRAPNSSQGTPRGAAAWVWARPRRFRAKHPVGQPATQNTALPTRALGSDGEMLVLPCKEKELLQCRSRSPGIELSTAPVAVAETCRGSYGQGCNHPGHALVMQTAGSRVPVQTAQKCVQSRGNLRSCVRACSVKSCGSSLAAPLSI